MKNSTAYAQDFLWDNDIKKQWDNMTHDNHWQDIKLIETEHFSLSLWEVVLVCGIVLVTMLILKIIRRLIIKNRRIDAGKQYSIYSLTHYVIWVFSVLWILKVLGVNISLLLGGSAALLVGVGLGLQNLFCDFVSGIILLIDSSIKVGDVVEINDLVCQVKEIHLRTTLVVTRDDKFILLPNSQLTQNNIINWTHSVTASRFQVQVGVGYDSDAELVKRLLLEIIHDQSGVLSNPEPAVRFTDFQDSTLQFTLFFWSEDVFRVEAIKSEIRFKIYERFNQYHIDISLPQRVVHLYNEERGEDFKRYTKDDYLPNIR